MADLPHTGQPEWEPAQSSPWLTQNHLSRTYDAFAVKIVVLSRENTPPVDCEDGARYLIDSAPTGVWAGKAGGIAIAKGADAANGWIIVPAASIAQEGNEIYIVEERITLQRQVSSWVEGTILFVDLDGIADGNTLAWDQSNGLFYPTAAAGGSGGSGSSIITTDADDYTLLSAHDNYYIRLTAAGTKQIIIQDEAIASLPTNGEWHLRNVQGGVATIVPDTYTIVNLPTDGTLVIEAGGTITLKRVAYNEFDLFGLVTAA